MSKKYIVVLLFNIIVGFTSAQNTPGGKFKFHSVNSVALINGDNAVSVAFQTINGFQKGGWFAGAGIGLDYYLYRTVPLFADIRYEFGKKKNKFFLYGDAGVHFDWVQDYFYDDPTIWNGNRRNKFTNGLYTDAGVGLSAGMKNGNAFVLSLGYSGKVMDERISHWDWRTGNIQTDVNTYRLRRIIVKLGFRF
jgi:hypothetical protein